MDDQVTQVDLNTADMDELRTLPGVGPALAERLLQARPFASIEDLGRVNGFGPAAIERLQPHVTLSKVETSSLATDTEEELAEHEPTASVVDESSPEAEEGGASMLEPAGEEISPQMEAEMPEAPQTPKPQPASQPVTAPKAGPRPASRMEAFWLACGALVFATLLGAALSLGFLALINGGLSYARPSQINQLARQIDGTKAQTGILEQDMDTLRARIDNLEGLSGRVGTVEKDMEGLLEDMDAALSSMDALSLQVENLDGQVAEIEARTERFQGFLEGLQELLGGLFSP